MSERDRNDRRRTGVHSRRDFIRLAAGSLGGTLLGGAVVGCGESDLDGSIPPTPTPPIVGASPLPNGYVFHRVLTPGSSSPFGSLASLGGGVTNNSASILLHGRDVSGAIGLYRIDMGYNGTAAPSIMSEALLLQTGMTVPAKPNPKVVDRIYAAAINDTGVFSSFAAVIGSKEETPTVLVNLEQGGFEPLVNHLDPTPGGGTFGAHFSDLAINDNDDLLLVADYYMHSDDSADLAQGLFLLDGSTSSRRGKLVRRSGDMVANTADSIARFGICDLDNSQSFVAQVFADTSMPGDMSTLFGQAAATVPMRSGVIQGTALDPSEPTRLIAGMPGRRRIALGEVAGNVILGPRITNGIHTAVVHPTADSMILYYNGTSIMQTGDRSPQGDMVRGIGPASVAPDGLSHFLVVTDNGMELVVTNGVEQKTILKYGDTLANSSAHVAAIVHGYHSKQSDSMGRIVFIAEFDDMSQSVVVGIPV